MAVVEQGPLRRADVPARDGLGQTVRQPGALQGGGVVGLRQVLVGDGLPGPAGDFGGQFGQRVGLVAGQFVGLPLVPIAGQCGGRRLGVIGACGTRNLAAPGVPRSAPPATAPGAEPV